MLDIHMEPETALYEKPNRGAITLTDAIAPCAHCGLLTLFQRLFFMCSFHPSECFLVFAAKNPICFPDLSEN